MPRSSNIRNNHIPVIVWQLQEKGSVRAYPNLQPWHRVKNFGYLPQKLNPSEKSYHEIQSLLQHHFGRGIYKITWYGDEIFRTREKKVLI